MTLLRGRAMLRVVWSDRLGVGATSTYMLVGPLRRWVPVGLGLALAGVFTWLTIRRVDWTTTWAALCTARWGLLVFALPLLGSSALIRGLRWRVLLHAHAPARWSQLALAAGVGLGANAVLPGKLGEAVAAHALGRLNDLSRLQSLGIIVVTRVIDVLVVFALVLAASFVLSSPTLRTLQTTAIAVIAVCAVALLIPLALRWRSALRPAVMLRRLARRVIGAGPLEYAEKFVRGLRSAGQFRLLVAFALITAGLWLTLSISLGIALHALRIDIPATYVPLVMGLIAASTMLPSAPGSIGTVHYFGILVLGLVGVNADLAAACIIVYHALDMLAALLTGAVCTGLARRALVRSTLPAAQGVVHKASATGLEAPESVGVVPARCEAAKSIAASMTEDVQI